MMPARKIESSPGHRVLVHECDGCGAPAPFGEHVDLRRALATGDVKHAGRWLCGWDTETQRPVCRDETERRLG